MVYTYPWYTLPRTLSCVHVPWVIDLIVGYGVIITLGVKAGTIYICCMANIHVQYVWNIPGYTLGNCIPCDIIHHCVVPENIPTLPPPKWRVFWCAPPALQEFLFQQSHDEHPIPLEFPNFFNMDHSTPWSLIIILCVYFFDMLAIQFEINGELTYSSVMYNVWIRGPIMCFSPWSN